MYYKLPKEAREELVLKYWNKEPYSLNIIALEIRMETDLGKSFLSILGFEDD